MSAGLILFSVILFVIGRSSLRQRAGLQAARSVSVSGVSAGRVNLSGRARGEPASNAPITGRPCAYWEAELWDTRRNRNRLPVVAESANVPLVWLEDDSGRIPVVLHGVEWHFAGEDEFISGQPVPSGGHQFITRHDHRWESGYVKLRERRIEEGGALYVHGVVAPASDVIRTLESLKDSTVARAVSAITSGRDIGSRVREPFSLAGYLRTHVRPDDRVVWRGQDALMIGDRAPAAVAHRLQWTGYACYTAGVLCLLGALMILLT